MQSLAVAVDNAFQQKSSTASPAFTGTPTAPTAVADTSTTQIATTQFVLNQAGTTTPAINGTGAAGSSLKFARQDHVHPTDTTRSPVAGSASITTVGTIGSGTWQGTAVQPAYGGTGLTSYAIGDILYASGATTVAKLADVVTGNVLISGGVGAAPSYGKVGLTTHVSGTLPVANGGTGVTSSTGSGDNVLGTSPTISTPAITGGTISNTAISGGTISNATSITVTGTQTLAAYRVRNMYVSTTDPGTGADGDIWLKY
jgi:hypothetical protein